MSELDSLSVYEREHLYRIDMAKDEMQYGISFLDDALEGILPHDLIIITGRTGTGKTELSATMARKNLKNHKRVTLFALEAAENEILSRLKFQETAKRFFENREKYPSEIIFNYPHWYRNKYWGIPEMELLELEVTAFLQKELYNLNIITPMTADFTKTDLDVLYSEYSRDSDLIILDHLHYIAMDDKESEIDNIKKIMFNLRNLINKNKKPVIAFSHTRKVSMKDQALVPVLEDIHGSSEIVKQANAVISFAACRELPSKTNPDDKITIPLGDGGTLFKVLKARAGHSSCTNYVGYHKFNFNTKNYDENYVPYKINYFCNTLTPMKYVDFENWMGLAREPKV